MDDSIIHIENLYKVYMIGTERLYALGGVSFDIAEGTFACVVGRSGSGKSTMLNMMAGLEKPSRGIVRIAGQRLDRMNEAKLVRFRLENVGFIFQSFNLFPSLTALENVAVPLMYRGVPRGKRNRMAREMLARVGLESHLKHRPTQMSGGQQQRVGIARALVSRPKIIFADEPTGNLDSRTSDEVLDMMRDICHTQGLTLVMVTHDPSIAAVADMRIPLLDGVIDDSWLPTSEVRSGGFDSVGMNTNDEMDTNTPTVAMKGSTGV